jgi:hypothetical protein
MNFKTMSDAWTAYIKKIKSEAQEAIAKGICVECNKPAKWYTEDGEKEYYISGLCEKCFDEITKEDN